MPGQLTRRRPTPYLGDRAVVLGGSMSGLLTARVLADFYRDVIVLERDRLPEGATTRQGVPQARHAHVLLPRGASLLDEMFPGLLHELVRGGVPVARGTPELQFDLAGHALSSANLERHPSYGVSRQFLESTVLGRVKRLPNVRLMDEHALLSLESDRRGHRVTGARISCASAMMGETTINGDLLVDATGRDSHTTTWLTELGHAAPREDQVKVDVGYASRRLRFAPGAVPGVLALLIGPRRDRPTGIGALAQEEDHWMVTLAGFGGHHPPLDENLWLAFAAQMAPSWLMSALLGATPLGDVHGHRFPANLRRRYEKLESFPQGLLVTGDALASFNPIYGQGMTVAALEAVALHHVLRAGTEDLAKRFFHAAARPVGSAWRFAVAADMSMPEAVVPGPRSLPRRAVSAYMGRRLAGKVRRRERDPRALDSAP